MEEGRVKEIVESWLKKQPNVSHIRKEETIIPTGLTTDLMGVNSSGEIVYIVECKGSVQIGELAKGIGQAFQYSYQKQFNKKTKHAEVLLVVPDNINNYFDILFVPDKIKVYLVKEDGKIFERRKRRRGPAVTELQLPQTFYIRDMEFNHLRDIILLIYNISIKKKKKLTIYDITSQIRRKYPYIAASGYNHLITLHSLGLLNSQNKLSPEGYRVLDLIENSDEEFNKEMSKYFYCFIINVINAIILIAKEKRQKLDEITCTNEDIAKKICQTWGQTVRFMYDSRTINTIMRILKELDVIDYSRKKVVLKRLIHSDFLP